VLFTSGSTGEPKGVVCTHRAFSSSSAAFARATNMVPASRVFHFASLTFDVALMEVLSSLTMGACVCVPSEHDRLHDLGGAITRQRATWAFLTPSVANLLDPQAVCAGGAFRTLVCGGEAMQSETVARWADRLELVNGYGPTEACVLAVVNPRVKSQADRAVIGRATGAGRAWIVEPLSPADRETDGNPEQGRWLTPVGAAGELAISGPLLAEGYLNDAAKTRLAFVDKPAWASSTGPKAPQRIYRTGDLVKYAADGSLVFLGRRDGQVKVNGQRLELGEIESRLSADPRIRLALVLKPGAGPCKDRLTGVVTLQSTSGAGAVGDAVPLLLGGPPDAVALARKELRLVRDALGEALPAYMVPTSWLVLRDMPIVVSGKLDRKQVAGWVDGLEEKTYEKIVEELGLNDDGEEDGVDFDEAGLAEVAAKLRKIWAKELHLQFEKVTLDRGFLGLGTFF
jgi:amino acid adenylation domain-containing protein